MSEIGAETKERLDSLLSTIDALSQSFAGYPCNLNFDYSELLPFFQYCVQTRPGDIGTAAQPVPKQGLPQRRCEWVQQSEVANPVEILNVMRYQREVMHQCSGRYNRISQPHTALLAQADGLVHHCI